jgi:molybdopterin-guanine dinucleotide biosynthesis protein MobB
MNSFKKGMETFISKPLIIRKGLQKSVEHMYAQYSMPIISVVGSRHSGKTTTVEAIVDGLVKKGYRVATVKHVHQVDFTIDAPGRDTWRHAQAGAKKIMVVAAKEMTTIKKVDTRKISLSDVVKECENSIDIIIIEGFRGLVASDLTVPKIVTVRNRNEMAGALRVFKPIMAFAGLASKDEIAGFKIPFVDVKEEPRKLIEAVERQIEPIVKVRRELKDTLTIDINGKMLPLNQYVQTVTRKVLFALVSTLKGATINGNENVKIAIRSQ